MDVLGAAVASVVTCVCSCMCSSVLEKCQHLENPTKELEVLRNKREELADRLEDVLKRLQKAEEQGQTRTREAQNLLDKCNSCMTAVEILEKKIAVAKGCLHGVLPNCSSRLHVGRDISKLVVDMTYLLEKADRLSDDRLSFFVPEMGMEMATARLFGKETAEKNLAKVWEYLIGDEVKTIGVYGMGGIGKTTMMKNIHNRLLKLRIFFDKVFWITVSKDANAYKLHNDIARELKIDLSSEQDETRRSSLLLKEFRRNGNFLLILDDMWEAFPLYEIGIPIDLSEDNGSKLVLTTRSLDVCQKMGCQKNVQVELFSENESWELFVKTVGVKLAPKVEKIAKKLVNECSCLPLAIVTVGGAMKGNDSVHDWRNALIDLRKSTNCVIKMEEKVIERLKFSYNRLEDDIVKKCFLYCAWFPEDFKLNSEELIDHWVMEGLINSRRIQDGVYRGHGILNHLKRCCLLEVVTNDLSNESVEVWVKMHDLIRDMALSIVNMNPRIMVKAGVRMEDFPDESGWREDLEKVSLVGNRINEILISPKVSTLTTLLLNYCHSLKHIAHGFFVQMECLRVLNLCHNYELELLPESVSNLVHLHVLDASSCHKLKGIPSVEKLLSLKVLRLRHTAIEKLPHGMEALVNLERLDLMGTNIGEITCSLISKFLLLKELLVWPLPISSDHLFLSLTHLENVWICFKNLSDFCYHIGVNNFSRLNDFDFRVGGPYIGPKDKDKRRRSAAIAYYPPGISKIAFRLPQNTEELFICLMNDVLRCTELQCLKDAKQLRKFTFAASSTLEYVMFQDESHLLQHLEDLRIFKCSALIGLYKGVACHGIFPCLRILRVEHCHSMKYLFSFTLLKHLHNLIEVHIYTCNELEEIIITSEEEEEKAVIRIGEGTSSSSTMSKTAGLKKLVLQNLPKMKMLFPNRMSHYFQKLEEVVIKDCHGMEELIFIEDEVRDDRSNNNKISIVFPRLTTLTLYNLPKLKSIWRGEMICDSLQSIQVSRCVKLQSIPQFSGEDQLPPPSMKQITGSIRWWDSLKWEGTSFSKNLLQPFLRLDQHAQEAEELDEEAQRIDAEADEEINEALHCGICSKLLCMPVVVACGHIFCYQCLVKGMRDMRARFMSSTLEYKCQTCRSPVIHLPSICQILHFLVLEMYPVAYKKQQIHALVEENTRGHTFPCQRYLEVLSTLTIKEDNVKDGTCELVSVNDVFCSVCKQLLIQPVVLNCGHVYCQSCIAETEDEPLRCQLCQRRHPQGSLKVCLVLVHLLEKRFPEEYALRRQAAGLGSIHGVEAQNPTQCSQSVSSSGSHSVYAHKLICDDCQRCIAPVSATILSTIVDSQVWPIVGQRYKCRDCKNFNLYGECYHFPPRIPVNYSQNHKADHTFKLIEIIVVPSRDYIGSQWSPLTRPL